MRRPRRRRRPRHGDINRPGHGSRFLISIMIFTVLMVLLSTRIRPIIESVAAYQVRVYAAKIINDALIAELDKMNLAYDDLIKVTQKPDGMVTSIQSNMININRIKAQTSQSVILDLENGRKPHVIKVPVGTLLGNELLFGRGPPIEIKILPIGYVQSSTYNEFLTAGINQTLHQIMLRMDVRMTAVIPGYSITTDTVTNFCIAETVIVGEIPDSFTQVYGDGAPLISKINDYAGR